MKKDQILFILIFTFLGLTALQIPFTTVLGSGTKFTLFDFFAPTAGAFIGTLPGVISVFTMQVINIVLHGGKIADLGGFIRLFPVLFGVVYFSRRRSINLIVPLLSMIAFNLHPIGHSAWQYSLFWFIPVVTHFLRKNLFFRSLGATFAAHAVGGALWVWAFGLTREMWLALIPQTAMERTLMAAGISISYVVLTNILSLAMKKKLLPSIRLEKHYLFV